MYRAIHTAARDGDEGYRRPHCRSCGLRRQQGRGRRVRRQRWVLFAARRKVVHVCSTTTPLPLCDTYAGFPTIVAVLDGKLVDTYSGERTAAAIGKWGLSTANKQLAAKLGGGGGSGSSSGGAGKAGGGAATEPGGGKAVLKLTAANFDAKVTKSDAPVLVEFFAPWCGA